MPREKGTFKPVNLPNEDYDRIVTFLEKKGILLPKEPTPLELIRKLLDYASVASISTMMIQQPSTPENPIGSPEPLATSGFGPSEWIDLASGNTGNNRRLTLDWLAKANDGSLDQVFQRILSKQLDPYKAADNMITAMGKAGLARSTMGLYRSYTKLFYKSAEVPGFNEDRYELRVTKVPAIASESEAHTIPEEGLKKFMRTLSPEWQFEIGFLTNTGCRYGEAFDLKIKDIDFGKTPVRVTFSAGKTKTNKHRTSFLSTETVSLFQQVHGPNPNPETRLFKWETKNSFYNLLARRLKVAGLTELKTYGETDQIEKWTIHPHSFRATNLAITKKAGIPNDWAEKLVGHDLGGVQSAYSDIEDMAKMWMEKVNPKMIFLSDTIPAAETIKEPKELNPDPLPKVLESGPVPASLKPPETIIQPLEPLKKEAPAIFSPPKYVLCGCAIKHFRREDSQCDRVQPAPTVTYEKMEASAPVLELNPYAKSLESASILTTSEKVVQQENSPSPEESHGTTVEGNIGKCYDCFKYHTSPVKMDGSGGPCKQKLGDLWHYT